jgi:hypothetical protein
LAAITTLRASGARVTSRVCTIGMMAKTAVEEASSASACAGITSIVPRRKPSSSATCSSCAATITSGIRRAARMPRFS